MATPHQYCITPRDPGAHLFEVTVRVASPEPSGQVFSMAAWVPGSYLIRDLARHVVAIRAVSDGQEIGLQKIDKSSWQADACVAAITLTAEIHAYDLNVRGAHLDTTHGFFDGACVFPAVVGQEEHACNVEIRPPAGAIGKDWRVATSMQPVDAAQYGFGHFAVEDYAELIDHPVEMGKMSIGEFEACGIPHVIAVRGHAHFDMARICHDLSTLCTYQLKLLGKPENLDRYVFLLHVQQNAYGGLEHRWSSSLACSRRNLPGRGESGVSESYRKFLGLCSHEYFHLWHVKRIRPEKFTPHNLRAEVHTGLLWVFEGITSYYDHLVLARSGLITARSYLEHLAKSITRLARTQGRFRQTIEESSFDAWSRFYRQDANSSNAIVSYYTKGALVALVLDLTLRKESQGQCTLDDVMRECWSRYGESGEGMPERGLESIARSVSGLELADFFERYVRGTAELPLQHLLREVGVELRMRAALGSKDAGGKPAGEEKKPPPWLGARLAARSGESTFGVVHSGSPAEAAGIAPGDIAVSLDDLRLNARNLDARLREHHAGDTVIVAAFRDEHLMRFKVTLGTPPEDACYLELDKDPDPGTEAMRTAWLSGAACSGP